MSTQEETILRRGADEWNKWRRSHPHQTPDLSGLGLVESLNLDGADLAGVNLTGATFFQCSLHRISFKNADLSGVTIRECALQESNLTEAILAGAKLYDVTLCNSVLERATLSNVLFHNVTLTNVIFEGADCADARFDACDLSGATFRFAQLPKATIAGCNIRNVDVGWANLEGVRLFAPLGGGNGIPQLRNFLFATYDESTLIDFGFPENHNTTVKSGNRTLAGYNLSNKDLKGCDFQNIELSESRLDGADLTGANLQHVTLRKCDCRNAIFDHANLGRANLRDTTFEAASFCEAILTEANLQGCNFLGARQLFPKQIEHSNNRKLAIFDPHINQVLKHKRNYRADLFMRRLQEFNFSHEPMKQADLTDCYIPNVDFSYSNIERGKFVRVIADGAIFDGAQASESDFTDAELGDASFQMADLLRAKLIPASVLSVFQFGNARLAGATMPPAIKGMEHLWGSLERAKHCWRMLLAFLTLCAAFLILVSWGTDDTQLLTGFVPFNVGPLRGDVGLRQIYELGPAIMIFAFVVLQLYLIDNWNVACLLPAVLSDGTPVHLRTHLWLVNWRMTSGLVCWPEEKRSSPLGGAQRIITVFVLYFTTPTLCLLLWWRYLAVKSVLVSLIHCTATALSAALALVMFRLADEILKKRKPIHLTTPRLAELAIRQLTSRTLLSCFGALLCLSLSSISSIPSDSRIVYQQVEGPGISSKAHFLLSDLLELAGFRTRLAVRQQSISNTRESNATSRQKGVSLAGMNLRFLDGARASFAGADLRSANLSFANLTSANMKEVDTRGADMRGADLSGADLSFATLGPSTFRGADLRRAKLTGAELSGTDLRGADLRGAVVDQTQLGSAITDAQTKLPDASDKR